jgi:uncharacterized membrane protein
VLAAFVTSYEFSVFLHITASVVGFGATFAEAIFFPIAMKLDKRHLPYVHRTQRTINQWFASPALLVVLATGFYQVDEGNWEMGDFWVSGTLTIVIVLSALIGGYFVPSDRRLEAMVAGEIANAGPGDVTLSHEYLRRSRTQGMIGAFAGLLIVAAIFLMVTKPGL